MRVVMGKPDEGQTPEAFAAEMHRHSPPDNEAPAAVAVNAVVGRSDDAAVILVGFQVYTAGVAFTLAVRLRQEPTGDLRRGIHELLFDGPGRDVTNHLLVGVEFSDGRKAANIRIPSWDQSVPNAQPILSSGGGGGGGKTYDQTTWLSPVPPPGPLTFVCAWSAYGIEETHTTVDGTAISEAAARVVALWPWEPPVEEAWEPTPLQLPQSGWFTDTLRASGQAD